MSDGTASDELPRTQGPDVDSALTGMSARLNDLPDLLAIPTLAARGAAAAFKVSVRPPGSKSLTNRALLLAALANGESVLHRPLIDADDARQMLAAVSALGAAVRIEPDSTVRINGVAGRWVAPMSGTVLSLNNAGTAVRFLAGAALLAPSPITIDGNARMRQRPIGELGEILSKMECGVEYLGVGGRDGSGGEKCPPIRITPPRDLTAIPSTIEVGRMHSSQFISALLLVAPWLPHGLTVRLSEAPTSASYIAMTAGLLAHVGATVQHSADQRVIRVHGSGGLGGLRGFEYNVEPDASGATYFWAAAAMVQGARCRVVGLDDDSLQGDTDFPILLRRMGAGVVERRAVGAQAASIEVTGPAVLKPILADMSDMPDAAMTLAAVACFAEGTSILRGLSTLRVKETDRIAAVSNELSRIGVKIETSAAGDPDALTITPPVGGIDCSPGAAPVDFNTYDDHRMAMSLALIGLRRPNVWIKDPKCVAKTYPDFWRDFAGLYK